MLNVYKSLATKFPQFKGSYPTPKSSYIKLALKCSILKTAWYSTRFHGIIIVGRGSKIRVHRSASVSMAPKSVLVIGMAHDTPVGPILRMRPRSNLRTDGRVLIMRSCNVTVDYDAILTIGAGTFFNDGSSVVCSSATTIGPGCAISWGARILDTDVHMLVWNGNANRHAPVKIERDCWIGANAIVLKGTQLGAGSVVAAGAVVVSKVPPRSLVAGVPAGIIRRDVSWKL